MQNDEHRPVGESPLATIRRLASHAASGELIAANDTVEVHVYLLDGRLAWATSSTARQAFVEHLVAKHGVAADAIREVIEECQRTRRRVGETLVDWGLATEAQVRDALAAQIVGALSTLASHPKARTIFLPRRMTYAAELTFALTELVPSRTPSDLDDLAASLVATVLDSVPEVQWVEVFADDEPIARAARAPSRNSDHVSMLRQALQHGALDSLVARGSFGVIFGHRLAHAGAAIWCGATADVKMGVAASVLANAAGSTPAPRSAEDLHNGWQERALASASITAMASAIRTTDELVAAMVLDRDGHAGGAWRGPDDLEVHAAIARLLATSIRMPARERLAIRGQRGSLAYHGAIALPATGSVWLVMPSWASQGLGWALLQAVSRQTIDAGGDA